MSISEFSPIILAEEGSIPVGEKLNSSGFTILELLVAVSIIGVLSTIMVPAYDGYQARARDAQRLADMARFHQALETFYADSERYPGVADGISTDGEKVGDDNGPIETALQSYLDPMPVDPLHDGSTYYYAYDPVHCDDDGEYGVAFGFNSSENLENLKKETTCGPNQNLNNADYNQMLYPASSS